MNSEPNSHPELYFSPVDHRLHLLNAKYGVYNYDGVLGIVYGNLGDGPYIDIWQLTVSGSPIADLFQLNGGLLYSGNNTVVMLKADVPRELFTTKPPTDNSSWSKLGNELQQNAVDIDPTSFRSMLNQFTGQQFTISGATVSDLRRAPGGYRFVLDVHDGYSLGQFPITGVSGPGRYIVNYDSSSGAFVAQQATPPDPAILSLQVPSPTSALASVERKCTRHQSRPH